jgi:NADPH:quinone reductase-like Zn-dependent oxidoreductase
MTKALILKEAQGDLVIEDAQQYKPQEGELLIENVAVAQNPVDWKQRGTFATIN